MTHFNEGIKLVVGIDFGTSFSAYAYSYEYEKDVIHINSDWPSGSNAFKEATAILFDENKKFITFGEEAIVRNGDLDADQAKSWHFFNQFKMDLYQEKVSCLWFTIGCYAKQV